MSEQYKEDITQARQEAHDMFAGDSVAWAITAALPAIRAQPEDGTSERLMETDVEKNENDLELLLSALHLSSRRDDVTGSRGGHGSRGGFGTPRTTTFTPRTPGRTQDSTPEAQPTRGPLRLAEVGHGA